MSEKKKFNLLRYVYGELFLSSLDTTKSVITVESWKARSWAGILSWLVKQQHISALSVEPIDSKMRRISFIFNHSNVIYPHYIKYLQRLVDDRNVRIAV